MHPTRNDLSQKIRKSTIDTLSPLLADGLDLFSQVKQAHWTVKGPTFMMLHELFDKVAEEVTEWTDEIAERIAQLGGQPNGTVRVSAKKSRLPEYDLDETDGQAHVKLVADRVAKFGAAVREAIDTLHDAGDSASADLCTAIVRAVDLKLWFVESHVFGKK